MLFDVVIPVGPSDVLVLEDVVHHARKNIKGFRNMYVLTRNPVDISGCIWVAERDAPFPFSYEDVQEHCVCPGRDGWYYQQLLKLYANQGIPDLLDNYLVLDADTYILNPTLFVENGKPCYATGDEYHKPYFLQMSAMHPLFRKHHPKSGVTHHMFFQKRYVEEIQQLVEEYHNQPFWMVFLECAKYAYFPTSGASEYELYFHYMCSQHPEAIHIRPLAWRNAAKINATDYENYTYVSVHSYYRKIQVCYPFNRQTMVDHAILYNSFMDSQFFNPRPSDFGDNSITDYIILDWMRDVLKDLSEYVVLFLLPSALFNYNNEIAVYKALWEIEDPITCIQETDRTKNMRVLLVKSIPEVRDMFGKIQSLSELSTAYFKTSLVKSADHVDMADEWGILDLRVDTRRKKMLEVGKFMDISDLFMDN